MVAILHVKFSDFTSVITILVKFEIQFFSDFHEKFSLVLLQVDDFLHL